jgi:polysaccharide biosynthesis protein PslH
LATGLYDRVIIDHPQLAWLEPLVADKHCLITLSHNIEHELYFDTARQAKRRLECWIYNREAHLVQKLENRLAAICHQVWTLTRHDAGYFVRQPNHGKVQAFDLPPGLSAPPATSLKKTFDIGLIGSWAWKPNLEGLEWFLEQVYPQLPESLSIQIAGRGADRLMAKYPRIQYCGFVPDAQAFMAQARVVAIPTLTGGGVQIKTLDAIASGSSIVATSIALRGITNPPTTVQIVDAADDFAKLLILASSTEPSTASTDHAAVWFEHRKQKFLLDIHHTLLPTQSSSMPNLVHP